MFDMGLKNKRGEMGISQVLVGLFLLVIVIFAVTTMINYTKTSQFGPSLEKTSESFKTFFTTILTPLFSTLLNLNVVQESDQLLVVISFIMLAIILIATFDSVNIFGEDNKGKIVNIAVGILMSLIAVRYMPKNLWESLTAPTVALVPTMLVGLPFAVLVILSMKMKRPLGIKVLWLGYAVFMGYLVFFTDITLGVAKLIYGVFFALALIMFFFDATVRRFWHIEKNKLTLEDDLNKMNVKTRFHLRREIREWQRIISDSSSSDADVALAKSELKKASKKYGDVSAI